MSGNNTNYLVAVLPDRIQAKAAYLAWQQANFSIEQLDILGRGYKTADEFGSSNPNDEAAKQMDQLANWVVPFGFAAGYLFNLLTGIEIISWLGDVGNHISGGLFGAAAGAFGATSALRAWRGGSFAQATDVRRTNFYAVLSLRWGWATNATMRTSRH